MHSRFPLAALLGSLLGIATPVYAQVTRPISASTAQGNSGVVTIALHPGHGTTLNFRLTGERIRKVWLDDPSQVTLDFDDAGCLSAEAKAGCAAKVIHLRRIKRLNFPDLPPTATTSLTVLTDRNLYKFHLTFPNSGSPRYDTLEIQPDRRIPILATTQLNGQSGVQLLERGLQVAASRNLITPGNALWHRVRSLLLLIQQGIPMLEAAQQVGVSQALIARLAEMGQETRP